MFGEKTEEKAEKKEETITFTPGPGVTATVHGQNNNSNDRASTESEADSDETKLIARWRTYKESNPDGSLDGFYRDVLTTNSEVE